MKSANKTSRSKWSPEIIEQFKTDYPIMEWDDLIKKYKSPKSSLTTKAYQLGIKRLVGKFVNYTEEDDSIITEMFHSGYSDYQIAQTLSRSEASVKTRRGRLSLLVTPGKWTQDEEEILIKNYSMMPAEEVSKLLNNRSRDAVVAHAKVLGLSGYRPYHNYTVEEELFIKNNYLNMSDQEIGEELGHSRESIKNRRNKLGFHRPADATKYEDITSYFRKYNTEWKIDSMKSCGFKCAVTGDRFDEIHHLLSLNSIVKCACEANDIDVSIFDINQASYEEKRKIIQYISVEQKNAPLGVCLRQDIHKEFHTIYGYGNNTPEQFNEFVLNYYPNSTYLIKNNVLS